MLFSAIINERSDDKSGNKIERLFYHCESKYLKKQTPIIECGQKLYVTTSKWCFFDLNVNVSWVHLQLDFNMVK